MLAQGKMRQPIWRGSNANTLLTTEPPENTKAHFASFTLVINKFLSSSDLTKDGCRFH